jgi:hypothetical protein
MRRRYNNAGVLQTSGRRMPILLLKSLPSLTRIRSEQVLTGKKRRRLLLVRSRKGGLLAGVGVVVLGGRGVVLVLEAPLEDLLKDVLRDLR